MEANEILDVLLQGLAPGITDTWDLQPNPADPDFYEELYAVAQGFKWAVKDRVDQLRTERNPAAAVEKLEDYELAMGLLQTSAAQFGTTSQRQSQVVGRFRESGGLTKFSIQTVMQAYLHYADPSQIVVIEPNRSALKTAHTYPFNSPVTLGVSTVIVLNTPGNNVPDDSYVSDMGAQLRINVQVAGSGASGIIQLNSPFNVRHEWALSDYLSLGTVVGMNTVFDLQLYAQDYAPRLAPDGYTWIRQRIKGGWVLIIKNMDQLNSASLFVEGVGRNPAGQDGLGAALFQWGVNAQSAKLGAGADLFGAAEAIRRMDHCHLSGRLFLDGTVFPG